MSHDGAYGARASAAPAPGGPGSAQGANEFTRAPQYSSQDNGFATGGGSHQQGSGGASAPHHWSPQASPYGTGAGYAANQFAAPPAPQHHAYPSSTASPYGAGIGGGGGGQAGGPYQSHSSPYSFSVPQHQQHPHHRPGPYPSYNNHESGPPATNGAPNFAQHPASGLSAHTGGAAGGLGGSPAYHSAGITGMMSGMASHGSAASAHQGSYAPHYGGSALPPGGPISSSAPQTQQSMGAPGYPSAPQYSTQLPLAGRHRVTTTLWEDEGTLCFQVDARGVCVARRHDNSMINGTKLLNVCGMSRGKRDGILKNEKERIVVKVGAMHLKGVWITFQRGKQLAEQNGIADVLYPLFEPNIQSFLYHPDNYPRTAAVMAAAQERQAARKSGGMPGQGPASGLDMGGGPPATSLVGSSSQDAEYPGGQASWNAPHHTQQQQQHHYRHPVGNGGNYISSAPATAAHSPAHHNHSGYNTPGSGMLQSHGSQQAGTPLSNHGSVMRSSLGSNNGTIPTDRRHSNQLDVSGGGGNSMDHTGHSSNPYALSSNHSSMDNGLPSSASSSNNSNGPPTAGTLQSLPGIGSVGQRRTLSSTSYKRGYGDEDGSGAGGPNGSSSYESASGMGGGGGGGAGASGDFYGQGGPGSERSYKRPRESGMSRGSGAMKHEGQDESYDTSAEYSGGGGGGGGGAPGGGMGNGGPRSVNGDKRGSGP